jgi:phosphate transport system substrate-binding protein
MISGKTIIFIFCLVILLGCKPRKSEQNQIKTATESKNDISGTFSISGGDALYPLVRIWAGDFMKIHPHVKIALTAGGTGQGIADLLAKRNELAMISRPLKDEELKEGIWVVPVAKEGVAPIVSQKNPFIKMILEHGITPEKLIRLFTGEKSLTWGDLLDTSAKEKVVVYTRADESGAADIWASFLWKERADLKGIKVAGDEGMIKSIQGNPLAIGFCNFSYAFDTVNGDRIKDIQVIPIDLDFDKIIDKKEVPFSNIKKAHRGLWLGYYPKNLTRELIFGSMGKPTDAAILEFLNYALTTGQSAVGHSGFCELNDVYIKNTLDRLK